MFKDHLVQLSLWWVWMRFWAFSSPVHYTHWCAWAFSSPGWRVSASPRTTDASVPLSPLCWTHSIKSMSVLCHVMTCQVVHSWLCGAPNYGHTSAEWRGRITCFDLWSLHFILPRMVLAFFSVKLHCWLVISFLSPRTPMAFSTELLSSKLAPSVYGACIYSSPQFSSGLCISPY